MDFCVHLDLKFFHRLPTNRTPLIDLALLLELNIPPRLWHGTSLAETRLRVSATPCFYQLAERRQL